MSASPSPSISILKRPPPSLAPIVSATATISETAKSKRRRRRRRRARRRRRSLKRRYPSRDYLGQVVRDEVYIDLLDGETESVHYINLNDLHCDPPEDAALCTQFVRLSALNDVTKITLFLLTYLLSVPVPAQCCNPLYKYTTFCTAGIQCY